MDKTFKEAIKQTKDNIQKMEKEIAKQSKKYNINRQAIINLGYVPSELQQRNSDTRENGGNSQEETNGNGTRDNEGEQGETKPKWWQFIKRFKAWNEKRQLRYLGNGTQEQQEPTEARNIDTRHSQFANSMKYDIVKDAIKRAERESTKSATRQYNESERNNDEGAR